MYLLLVVCNRRALEAARAPAPGADRPLGRFRPCPTLVLLSTNQCSFSFSKLLYLMLVHVFCCCKIDAKEIFIVIPLQVHALLVKFEV